MKFGKVFRKVTALLAALVMATTLVSASTTAGTVSNLSDYFDLHVHGEFCLHELSDEAGLYLMDVARSNWGEPEFLSQRRVNVDGQYFIEMSGVREGLTPSTSGIYVELWPEENLTSSSRCPFGSHTGPFMDWGNRSWIQHSGSGRSNGRICHQMLVTTATCGACSTAISETQSYPFTCYDCSLSLQGVPAGSGGARD